MRRHLLALAVLPVLAGSTLLATHLPETPRFVQPPFSGSIDVPLPWETAGQRLAAKADEAVKAEMAKYARSVGWFGIGKVKPSGEVSYVCTTPIGGAQPGYEMRFQVHARVKVDVGPRKWAAVDTVQTVVVRIVPRVDDGKPVVSISAEVTWATASKERQAHQADADKFRDAVRSAITKALQERVPGEVDVLAELKKRSNVLQDNVRVVHGVVLHENSLTVLLGQPATVAASLDVPTSVTSPGTVTLYQHSEFRGETVVLSLKEFGVGKAYRMPDGWNDKVSSVRWDLAPGVEVTLYQHNPPSGKTYQMKGSGSDSTLSDNNFNDAASSWKFTR